jgi:hypothetical protein
MRLLETRFHPVERGHYGDPMNFKSDIDEYRERVFTAMREAGLPVNVWQREYEQELAANPTAKARPYNVLRAPKYGKIRKLRPGFEEFIPHPVHRKPVPRCQAARKRTGGKAQCKKFAANGTHLCRTHGGAVGSGKLTHAGRAQQILSVTKDGSETRLKRNIRSHAAQIIGELKRRTKLIEMIRKKAK